MINPKFKNNLSYLIILLIGSFILYFLFGLYAIFMIPLFLSSLILQKFINSKYEYKKKFLDKKNSFLNFLRFIVMKTELENKGAISILESASQNNKDIYANKLLKRLNLGENIDQSLSDIKDNLSAPIINEIIGNLKNGMSLDKSINSVLNSEMNLIDYNYMTNIESIKKYSIATTLTSIIIPTFLIFGFIGYSILNPLSIMFIIFASVLLFVLPIINLIIKNKMSLFYYQIQESEESLSNW